MEAHEGNWNDDALAFLDRDRADALEALRACLNETPDAEAVLLIDRDGTGEWDEAQAEDMEDDTIYGFQIVDGSGSSVLVPQGAYDADERLDDIDVPAPKGYLWIVP